MTKFTKAQAIALIEKWDGKLILSTPSVKNYVCMWKGMLVSVNVFEDGTASIEI